MRVRTFSNYSFNYSAIIVCKKVSSVQQTVKSLQLKRLETKTLPFTLIYFFSVWRIFLRVLVLAVSCDIRVTSKLQLFNAFPFASSQKDKIYNTKPRL